MEAIIEVKNLSKKFYIMNKKGDKFKAIFNGGKSNNVKYALDNVSFKIYPGDVVGVIGRNGSGKSTILEIISGIKDASSGEVKINGTIALLAVKSFLSNEMTGRENIYFKGKMMGMSKSEIESKIDEIIEFSEVEEYIDMPLKQYSSGMKAKLGFAISINIDADILIIDEALAVGDVAFRLKCLEKMKEFKDQNKTIIYVSHSKDSIMSFCTRALLLNNGVLEVDGTTIEVANRYNEITSDANTLRNVIYNKRLLFGNKNKIYTKGSTLDMTIEFDTKPIEFNLNLISVICDNNNKILFEEKVYKIPKMNESYISASPKIDISDLDSGLYKVYYKIVDDHGTLTIPVYNYKEFQIK